MNSVLADASSHAPQAHTRRNAVVGGSWTTMSTCYNLEGQRALVAQPVECMYKANITRIRVKIEPGFKGGLSDEFANKADGLGKPVSQLRKREGRRGSR